MRRLAAYWHACRPPRYSQRPETGLQRMHAGNGDMSDLGRRFVVLFVGGGRRRRAPGQHRVPRGAAGLHELGRRRRPRLLPIGIRVPHGCGCRAAGRPAVDVRTNRSPTSSRRGSLCCSAGSIPRCCRPPAGTTSRGRATGSGRRCTSPGSLRPAAGRPSRTDEPPRYGLCNHQPRRPPHPGGVRAGGPAPPSAGRIATRHAVMPSTASTRAPPEPGHELGQGRRARPAVRPPWLQLGRRPRRAVDQVGHRRGPYRGSSSSCSGVIRDGVRPARCSAGQKRLPGRAKWCPRAADMSRGVDPAEQHIEPGRDDVPPVACPWRHPSTAGRPTTSAASAARGHRPSPVGE